MPVGDCHFLNLIKIGDLDFYIFSRGEFEKGEVVLMWEASSFYCSFYWYPILLILDPTLTEGVLCNHPCLSVGLSVGPSLNISDTVDWYFLIFCIKLGQHKGTKVTEPDFWKKIFGVINGGKTQFLGYFWCFLSISLHPVIKIFWNFIYIISSTLSNT